MDDQTKSTQTLSIVGSIEHRKHNQLDIKYVHLLFIRNPQLGCLASHYKRNPNNNKLQNLGVSAKSAPLASSRALFPK